MVGAGNHRDIVPSVKRAEMAQATKVVAQSALKFDGRTVELWLISQLDHHRPGQQEREGGPVNPNVQAATCKQPIGCES